MAASLLKRKTGSGMVKWRLHEHFEVDRSVPIRIDVTRRAGLWTGRKWPLRSSLQVLGDVLLLLCGLASEAALLAHKRKVATATSRFMNAAPVVIDRLKPVLLFGMQSPCR